jgi:hypothetical protein
MLQYYEKSRMNGLYAISTDDAELMNVVSDRYAVAIWS